MEGKGASARKPDGALDGAYYDPRAYTRNMLRMIDYVRSHVGDEIELLHDVHERLSPIDTVKFAKDLEPYNLFFLEDSSRRKTSNGSATSAASAPPQSPWVSYSTTRTNGGC